MMFARKFSLALPEIAPSQNRYILLSAVGVAGVAGVARVLEARVLEASAPVAAMPAPSLALPVGGVPVSVALPSVLLSVAAKPAPALPACFSVVFAYSLLIPHTHILTGIMQNCAKPCYYWIT
jgi:hypothetical protein